MLKKIAIVFLLINMFHTCMSFVDDYVNPFDYELNYTELAYMEE